MVKTRPAVPPRPAHLPRRPKTLIESGHELPENGDNVYNPGCVPHSAPTQPKNIALINSIVTDHRTPKFEVGTKAIKDAKVWCTSHSLVAMGSSRLRIYHVKNWQLKYEIPVTPRAVIFASGKLWVALTSGKLQVYSDGRLEAELYTSHKMNSDFLVDTPEEVLSLNFNGKIEVWSKSSEVRFLQTRRTLAHASFVFCCQGNLWVCRGKEICIQTPLETVDRIQRLKMTTDISSWCVVDDLVLIGDTYGKVSLFKNQELQKAVRITIYSITSITCCQGCWWAGTILGSIIVLNRDCSKILREFKTHDVPAYVSSTDRFILSTDQSNVVKAWEATEQCMHTKAGPSSNLKVDILTWNLNALKPSDINLNILFGPVKNPDILVVGFQEVIRLESTGNQARLLIRGNKEAKNTLEHTKWVRTLRDLFPDLQVVCAKSLVGLFCCVLTKKGLRPKNTHISIVKTGLGGRYGNKGGIIVEFKVGTTSFCFVNCHLAAGYSAIDQRNGEAELILRNRISPEFVQEGVRSSSSTVLDHDICFFFGDTNYRVTAARRRASKIIETGNYEELQGYDQLRRQIVKNPTLRLASFQEAPIGFAPTYKFDPGTTTYDSSDKKRVPAWCDRILFRGKDIQPVNYISIDERASDHRPVFGSYIVPTYGIIDQIHQT